MSAAASRSRVRSATGRTTSTSVPNPPVHLQQQQGGWRSALLDARDAVATTWSDDRVLDQLLQLPWGRLPGAAAIVAYTGEVATHTWDLARATGYGEPLDDAVGGRAALAAAQRAVPAEPRGGPVPFGPVVDVPADADPYTRLAGWTGRAV